ncbi:hypothetical protein [Actinoplanes sp. NPDC049802]|uniref:hypothetical protein n=1 Tax=Actinoplanes sp. NPDC049802 TaxID=3154742 RepID=UPI0033F4E273
MSDKTTISYGVRWLTGLVSVATTASVLLAGPAPAVATPPPGTPLSIADQLSPSPVPFPVACPVCAPVQQVITNGSFWDLFKPRRP